jgi:serine/threonine-protein kinase
VTTRVPEGIAALREHLDRTPDDHDARLRLADRLLGAGERAAARQELLRVQAVAAPVRRLAVARLARLDEDDGEVAAAAERWERLLADDVEDPEAWAQLERLRRSAHTPLPPERLDATPVAPTLESPQGVNVSRYEIEREIGRGTSATVYLARERLLRLDVAIKVLHPHLAAPGQEAARGRFFREARTAAALRHPGVVAIYDVDEAARTIVMEHLAGGSLRDRLRRGAPEGEGALPSEEADALARSLLEAIAFVHARGIVHGDITPRNVLLRRRGAAVLADFGIARRRGRAEPDREAPAGTPLYLAPEQFRGAEASAATDLFAVGAVLWETLAGRPMREHADLAVDRFAAPPLPAPVRAAAPQLAALVERLTAVAPAGRPPSAEEALASLPRR